MASNTHPFQGVFYLQFASTYWVYAQVWRLVLTVCSTRSRAFCGEVIPAGRGRYTQRATNGANACDFSRLAHLAQARQDPERGARQDPERGVSKAHPFQGVFYLQFAS